MACLDYPKRADLLNHRALLYRKQGKYAQAERWYQQALQIYEEILGIGHLEMATPLNGLANVYTEQGKYMQAELLYQRALQIRERALGQAHLYASR